MIMSKEGCELNEVMDRSSEEEQSLFCHVFSLLEADFLYVEVFVSFTDPSLNTSMQFL